MKRALSINSKQYSIAKELRNAIVRSWVKIDNCVLESLNDLMPGSFNCFILAYDGAVEYHIKVLVVATYH